MANGRKRPWGSGAKPDDREILFVGEHVAQAPPHQKDGDPGQNDKPDDETTAVPIAKDDADELAKPYHADKSARDPMQEAAEPDRDGQLDLFQGALARPEPFHRGTFRLKRFHHHEDDD